MKTGYRIVTLLILLSAFVIISSSESVQANLSSNSNLSGVWQLEASPTSEFLKDVSMVSSTEGWAVGDNGTILFYDGTSWELETSPTTKDIWDVEMISSDFGWAVGGGSFGPDGQEIILNWNGTAWITVTHPYNGNFPLSSVSATSENDAWAIPYVGDNYLRWNGADWSLLPLPDTGIDGMYISARTVDDVWITGERSYHWNGTVWMGYHPGASYDKMSFVPGTNGTQAWCSGIQGKVYHWNGTTFSALDGPSTDLDLNGTDMISTTDGWMVGGNSSTGNGAIVRYDGSQWAEFSLPVTSWLTAVDMVSATDGWAVGADGVILHFTTPELIYLPLVRK